MFFKVNKIIINMSPYWIQFKKNSIIMIYGHNLKDWLAQQESEACTWTRLWKRCCYPLGFSFKPDSQQSCVTFLCVWVTWRQEEKPLSSFLKAYLILADLCLSPLGKSIQSLCSSLLICLLPTLSFRYSWFHFYWSLSLPVCLSSGQHL